MSKMEQWKDIKDYEGLYQISNKGRIRNSEGKILKAVKYNCGYLLVGLYKDGKQTKKLVHRLVAEAFIPNPQNLPQVNHKDEDKENNSVSNLEWCDAKYNTNYGTGVKRAHEKQINSPKRSKKVDQIDPITSEIVHQWESTKECGRNGFDQSHVAACARGEYGYKTYKGFIWKYHG